MRDTSVNTYARAFSPDKNIKKPVVDEKSSMPTQIAKVVLGILNPGIDHEAICLIDKHINRDPKTIGFMDNVRTIHDALSDAVVSDIKEVDVSFSDEFEALTFKEKKDDTGNPIVTITYGNHDDNIKGTLASIVRKLEDDFNASPDLYKIGSSYRSLDARLELTEIKDMKSEMAMIPAPEIYADDPKNLKAYKISPSTALLMAIKDFPQKNSEISSFLFTGRTSENYVSFDKLIVEFCKLHPEYHVATGSTFINRDPVRNYFETQFSFNYLINNLHAIDEGELDALICENMKLLNEDDDILSRTLSGNAIDRDDLIHKEYSDAIANIKVGVGYGGIPLEERGKLEKIVKLSFLSVAVAWIKCLPIDIYNTGVYDDDIKGKTIKSNQSHVTSAHMGMMKSYHPLPRDDIAYRDKATTFIRPVDQASFSEYAPLVVNVNSKLVHARSNGISGTMLCQARVLQYLKEIEAFCFNKTNPLVYIHVLASAMLFNSGGHSYNEFLSPFTLKRVNTRLSSVFDVVGEGYRMDSIVSNVGINPSVVDKTLSYFNHLEMKQKLHNELMAKRARVYG
ncbi:hypothetical protein DBV23_06785 [Edwardsiella ictaluri]|uniref:Uncharacterized protein n=1 Tax=Edwardsiella ictaluri (strain 93-146) TaxID=634503 RepID=C5BCE7_EDWI9|nr:hypothetical protein [Edwardsiella ictaluri]ACR67510.1 hypothetical protein NT01EI_0267 [Edwardsiella ictaluri 93-146]AVZ82005.1 hypothetical protein DBV23_06785 [Edwardsiella ictaluri]EKS7763377.1 hypothetical protein [Edwardsiella ictaluri]EKS7770197.1 hypothetical protein [Edwardsiella ictaluri]EKS7773338.1 hypothetical protein [Edwardsiella ictaluri]